MMYHIQGLCPRTDIAMSRCNFSIQLFPAWREEVKRFDKTQADINRAVGKLARAWLDGCGFDAMYDPEEEDALDRWKAELQGEPRKLSKSAQKLYTERDVRVTWGEWGPEHITVPGNACGLDLDSGIGAPCGGKVLNPHNIDTLSQVILLLTVFTWFADCLVMELESREFNKKEVAA